MISAADDGCNWANNQNQETLAFHPPAKPSAARTERARTRRKSDPFESPVFGDLLVRLEKVEMNDLNPLFSFVLHEGQGITSMNELML